VLSCAGWKWQGQTGNKLMNNKVEDVSVISDVECMNKCVLHDLCDSVNYRSSDSSCELNTHPGGANATDIVADNQWIYWGVTSDLLG